MFSKSSVIIKARFSSRRLLSIHYFIPVNSLNFYDSLPIFHPYLLLCSQLVISQFHSDTNQLSVSQFLSEVCVVRGELTYVNVATNLRLVTALAQFAAENG